MKAYLDLVQRLYALQPRGIRMELDRLREALARRGDPHLGLQYVHVAGTNGKGSTAAMIERALRAEGLRTGLYTSPHLHRFVERIRLDGRPISERALAQRASSLLRTLAEPGAPELTFFETATLLAFEVFRAARCDVVVLEVGLGGRLDATNVIERALVSVITRIALDHEKYLGTTIGQIAAEKAGILRAEVPCVVGARAPEARAAIAKRATSIGSPLALIDDDLRLVEDERGLTVTLGDTSVDRLEPSLIGAHQRDNVACAVGALLTLRRHGLPVSDRSIRTGVSRVRWPGRLELLDGAPAVLVDAAHNPDGCAALAAYLHTQPRTRRVLLFGAMVDKDHAGMLEVLRPEVDEVVHARPNTPRSAEPAALAEVSPGVVAGPVAEALEQAKRLAGTDGLVICAGSIFLLAEARAAQLGIDSEPPLPF